MKSVRIAVEGCCHGQLNKIYQHVPKNVELLIICGDFQAIRNQQDLKSINVPRKYLEMGDFPDYYSGKKSAPVLTVFIGGNHESSSYLRELQYGGWVAPNIYYLGEFGAIWYKGIRISGVSGIHSHQSFVNAKSDRPPLYTLPYTPSTIRSIYHVSPKSHLKLLLSGPSDITLSHDWPKGIWEWGNKAKLLKKKPFLKADMESGRLGSGLASQALAYLRPKNWFSSHMHTFFEARVKHEVLEGRDENQYESDSSDSKRRKVDSKPSGSGDKNEISLDMDGMDDMGDVGDLDGDTSKKVSVKDSSSENPQDVRAQSHSSQSSEECPKTPKHDKSKIPLSANEAKKSSEKSPKPLNHVSKASETYFMALDKCLPRRDFLATRNIEADPKHPSFHKKCLFYDAKAIAIQKVVENFVRTQNWRSVRALDLLETEKIDHLLTELAEMVDFEESKIEGDLQIPENFRKIAPDVRVQKSDLQYWPSNQTKEYCEKWGIPEPNLEGA